MGEPDDNGVYQGCILPSPQIYTHLSYAISLEGHGMANPECDLIVNGGALI